MLLNLLKTNNQVVSVSKTKPNHRSSNEIVKEIHETFYTEVDRLLSAANISWSQSNDKQDVIIKAERLQKLGFNSTKEVESGNVIAKTKLESSEIIEAIKYFSQKYPHYKFITEESVKSICEKYGLVYGEVGRYIGNVPDKNLKQIEDFKINEDDECWIHSVQWMGSSSSRPTISFIKKPSSTNIENDFHKYPSYFREYDYKASLEIAAPKSDFNLTSMEVKNFKVSAIQVPDPIVLQPVIFKNKKHYLIVTAWGDEASDELVVNEKHN